MCESSDHPVKATTLFGRCEDEPSAATQGAVPETVRGPCYTLLTPRPHSIPNTFTRLRAEHAADTLAPNHGFDLLP